VSKVLEELKKRKTVRSKQDLENKGPKRLIDYSDIQNKLSNTYLSQNKNNSQQYNNNPSNTFSNIYKKVGSVFSKIIEYLPLAAFLLLLILFFLFDKINIQITLAPFNAKNADVHAQNKTNGLFKTTARNIFSAAQPASGLKLKDVKGVEFSGTGKDLSKVLDDCIILINGQNLGPSGMALHLKKPVDLTSNNLVFFVRGAQGGERFKLIFSDNDNKTYVRDMPIQSIATDWQKVELSLKDLNASSLNAKLVTDFSVEYGSLTAGNRLGAVIYIKDIGINK